jgi:hypothetical protein
MVYRPPKKSSAASRFPGPQASVDPLSGPLSRAADGEEIMRGDDRNLVVVDDSYAGGDFEDRVWLFWRNQKGNLLLVAGLILVGVVGWQGWKAYQQHVADQLQADYKAAQDGPSLLAFAHAHPDTTFGKLAQLEAADIFYKEGKYADAVPAYTDAIAIWGTENYGQRARIGLALSLLQNNDPVGAHQQLESLAKDTQSVAFYRSEAAFDLAVLEAQAGNQKNVAQWVAQVNTLKDDTWIKETNAFIDILTAAPGSNLSAAAANSIKTSGSTTPAMPITLTNEPAAEPAAKATATTTTEPPAAAVPASTPAPAADTGFFDLSKLQKAANAGDTSN